MLVSMTAPLEALLFAAGSEGLSTLELSDTLQLSVEETRRSVRNSRPCMTNAVQVLRWWNWRARGS